MPSGSKRTPRSSSNKASNDSNPCDELHNRDRPCCHRLETVARRLLLEDGGGGLVHLLRDHILKTEEALSNGATSTSAKRKRKKKKKKRATSSPKIQTDNDDPVSTASAVVTPTTNGDNAGESTIKIKQPEAPPLNAPPVEPTTAPNERSNDPSFALKQHRHQRIRRLVRVLLDRDLSKDPTESSSQWAQFLATTSTTPSSSPIILQHTTVQTMLQSIACPNCRRDAERYCARSSSSTTLQGIMIGTVLDPYCTQELEERHSQYQLMLEEGTQVPAQEWVIERNEKGDWKVCSLGSSNDGWRIEDLAFLLEHYVLLQGLPPDYIVGKEQLVSQDKELDRLNQSSHGNVVQLEQDFQAISTKLATAIAKFNETSNHDKEDINLTFFLLVREVDETLDTLFNDLLRIATDATRRCFRVIKGCTSRDWPEEELDAEVHWLKAQCSTLWHELLHGFHQQLQALDLYEKELSEAADRQGGLREMFVDAKMRAIYRKLVDSKYKIIYDTIGRMYRCFHQETHVGGWTDVSCDASKTHFSRRLYTEDEFCQLEMGVPSRSCLDEAFEDVFTTLRELTETVLAGRIATFQEENRKRFGKFFRLVRTTLAVLQSSDQSYKNCRDEMDELGHGLKTTLNGLSLTDNDDDATIDASGRLSIVPSVQLCIDGWLQLHVRSTGRSSASSSLPIMPFEHRLGLATQVPTSGCMGGNGRVRFQSIVVSLFFEELLRKFNEWQSHMALEELLTTFEESPQADAKVSSKKQKKKKGKKTVVSPSNESTTDTRKDKDQSDSSFQKPKVSGVAVEEGSEQSVEDTGNNHKSSVAVEDHKHKNSVAVKDQKLAPVFVKGTADNDVQTLEDFLVGRLRSLLASKDNIIFP